MERRISHGFINKDSILDFSQNDIFDKFSKDNIKGCKNCEFRYACHDCRPNSNGAKINSKPWYCSYNQQKGEWKNIKKMYAMLVSKNKL